MLRDRTSIYIEHTFVELGFFEWTSIQTNVLSTPRSRMMYNININLRSLPDPLCGSPRNYVPAAVAKYRQTVGNKHQTAYHHEIVNHAPHVRSIVSAVRAAMIQVQTSLPIVLSGAGVGQKTHEGDELPDILLVAKGSVVQQQHHKLCLLQMDQSFHPVVELLERHLLVLHKEVILKEGQHPRSADDGRAVWLFQTPLLSRQEGVGQTSVGDQLVWPFPDQHRVWC